MLSKKHQRFVAEYLIDLNATQAARRAGYSEQTARQQGARLLTNVNILKAIEEGRKRQLTELNYTANQLLMELVEENNADLADLYTDDGVLKPVRDWPLVWRRGLVQSIDVEEIYAGSGEAREKVGEVRRLKLSDRLKRKELLGKHVAVQAFKERVEQDVSDPIKDLLAAISGNAIAPKEQE